MNQNGGSHTTGSGGFYRLKAARARDSLFFSLVKALSSMNHFTCTLTSGLGALMRDAQSFEGSDLLTSAGFAARATRDSDLCELALPEMQNKNKVSATASLPASVILFK